MYARPGTIGCFLGILLLYGSAIQAERFDQLVGADSPNGDAYLVKHFRVSRSAIVAGIIFYSNDVRTTFPSVTLLRGPAKTLAEAALLADAKDVRAAGSHRTLLPCAPVAVAVDEDLYVAIRLPPSSGIHAVGDGAGIAAKDLEGTPTSYFVSGRKGVFGAMDVDFGIELVFQQIGKASLPEPAHEVVPVFLKVSSPVVESGWVAFGVEHAARVTLTIYDVAGRRVRTVVQGAFAPGRYNYAWDGRDEGGVASATGIYFAKLSVGEKVLTEKLLLAR